MERGGFTTTHAPTPLPPTHHHHHHHLHHLHPLNPVRPPTLTHGLERAHCPDPPTRRRRLQVSGRYTSTLEALREAAPYALLVTHGFGVQAMAEHASEGKEIDDPAYCSLTRMRKLGGEDWSCDLICRADHLAEVAGGKAAKGNGGGGPMRTIAFSAASF